MSIEGAAPHEIHEGIKFKHEIWYLVRYMV